MSEGKRLLKNTGIIAIGNISTRLVSFLLLPLYTSILSTSEYGIVDYVVSISTFCVPFVSMLMDESMFRFLLDCNDEKERKQIISMSLAIILCGGGMFLIIGIPILVFLNYKYSVFIIIYVLSSILITMLSALLRGLGNIEQYVLYNFMVSIVKIILNILFIVVISLGVVGMLTASIMAQILVSLIFIIRLKLWKFISFEKINKSQAREMIKYSIPLIPNKVSWSIINLSDRIIIMNCIGSDASGLYAVSNKFPGLMDTVYGFFYQSWKESSARALQDDGVESFYNQVYKYLKRFMYTVVIGMTAFMPFVFKILINSKYDDAIVYVPILLLGTYFANISGFYGGVFTAHKDTKIMGTTTIVAAIINLVVNMILIWKVHLFAAVISTLVANFTVYIYRRIKVKRYIVLKESTSETVLSIIITTVIFYLFYSKNINLQVIGCIIAVVYSLIGNYEISLVFISKIKSK